MSVPREQHQESGWSENRKLESADAENRPGVGGSFFLEVSPDLPKALQDFWSRCADGCSMCRRGVIANTVDVGDGGNVWITTTERLIGTPGDRTPLPGSGLQKTGPPGRKRNRPHLRSQSDLHGAARSGSARLINPPCARRTSGDGFA